MAKLKNQTSTLPGGGHVPVENAARYVGLSASHMNKLRHFGGGPIYLKLGSQIFYRTSDLDAWLSAQRCSSTAENRRSTRTATAA